MTSRCTAHLWNGEDSTWICALKMGESPHNIGLVFTQGGTTSYSQNGFKTREKNLEINVRIKNSNGFLTQEQNRIKFHIFPLTK